MKIHQLPYGAAFLFQGETYVKTGPMLGTGKDGQKLFPRHQELQAVDEPAVVGKPPAMLAKEAVLKAFEAFFAECRGMIDDDRREALERARDRFLGAVD